MATLADLQIGFEKRRQSVVQDGANATSLHKVAIVVSVLGPGELVLDITFPVLYLEEPDTWSGCVYRGTTGVSPAAEVTAGALPIGTGTVIAWTRQTSNRAVYIGATVGVKTAGSPEDNIDVSMYFEGKATRRAGG